MAMPQKILLHLTAMWSPQQCQVPVAMHPYLKQHQPIPSCGHPGAVYGELNLPRCCALFPCQLPDKSATIGTADNMKCPKPIITVRLPLMLTIITNNNRYNYTFSNIMDYHLNYLGKFMLTVDTSLVTSFFQL